MIKGVIITPLKILEADGGSVMHAMKKSDDGFVDFGEAYFSNIEFNMIKAWKKHKVMTLNLVAPLGKVKIVLYDDRGNNIKIQEIILSKENYSRITIPPRVWFGFQGLCKNGSMLINIADIEHDSNEIDRADVANIDYSWRCY